MAQRSGVSIRSVAPLVRPSMPDERLRVADNGNGAEPTGTAGRVNGGNLRTFSKDYMGRLPRNCQSSIRRPVGSGFHR